MMKKYLLFAFMVAGLAYGLQAQTIFSATSPSGHTLYYHVVDRNVPQVEVCNPNNDNSCVSCAWSGFSQPYGNITVPASVTYHDTVWSVVRVGFGAFAALSSVQSITLPDGIDSIKDGAFWGSPIDSVNIPSSVVYIGSEVFWGTQIHHVNLPAGLLYIGYGQRPNPIMDFTIEEGSPYYYNIGGVLMRNENGLANMAAFPFGTIENGVMTIPEGVERVDVSFLHGGGFNKVILPSSLKRIGIGETTIDTLVLKNIIPPALDEYWNPTLHRIELPCGTQPYYAATTWGQYSSLFITTTDYLPQVNYTQTIIYGESHTWGDLSLTERGVYEDTLQSVVEGCDSVHRVLTLNVVQYYRSDMLLTPGGSLTFHGLTIDKPGVYDIMVPGNGDFDSLFVLRASAVVNATVADMQLGGIWEGEIIEVPAMQSQVFARGEDSITVTNIHQIIHNTVDVTINEGENYNGYTLAGVYQDTLYFADYDSIVRSRVSMNVNRPMDNCMVQLGSNLLGSWVAVDGADNGIVPPEAVTVLPMQTRQFMHVPVSTGNLLTNGDFELGDNNGFSTDYGDCNCQGYGGCGAYDVYVGGGVNGSYGMVVDGHCEANKAFWKATVQCAAGVSYSFSYIARNCGSNEPRIILTVDGIQVGGVDTVMTNTCDTWATYTRTFVPTANEVTLRLVDLELNGDGNDFFVDNLSLVVDINNAVSSTTSDTITITNTHGLVRDTVDVTIAEGGSYYGHEFAGVYQDTIIGNDTDSVVYSRVSMNINHTFGTGTTTLATNQEGRVWMGLDDAAIGTQPTLTVQVNPAQENHYVLTSLADGSNMQPNGDFERWQDNWSSEYAWGETPFQGSHYVMLCDTCGRTGRGLAVKGSMMSDRAFYQGEWTNLVAGHRYNFSYWTKSHSTEQPAELAIKVNDQQYEWQLPETDILTETEWTRHEHVFTAHRTYSTLMRIFDLNTSQTGNEFFLDDVSIVDLTEATDAYRDTIIVRNTHQLHYAIVDTTINEGGNYNGHIMAGVYNDTVVMADYDSITTARVSYVLNTTGEGFATLNSNIKSSWIDLDDNSVYTDSTVSVYPTEVRRFGLLTLAQDTNLIVNGDFEQGTMGFTSHYSYRPEPYPFNDDNTYYVGSYRIDEEQNNSFLHCHNYWYPRQGAYYSTTVNVNPNTWYLFSYKAGIDNTTNNNNIIEANGKPVAVDTFAFRSSSNWTGRMFDYTHLIYSGDTTTLTIVMDQRLENCFEFVIDDITLTPFTISDSIYITNRHQMLYVTVEVTINEGQAYNGHTLAGVYQDTIIGADADSIIRSRVSMNVNRPMDNCMVQLGSNLDGSYVADDQVYYGDNMEVQVIPGESKQMAFSPLQYQMGNNMVVNGDFEQGDYYPYVGDYATDDGDGYGSRTYGIQEGNGVDGSRCMWFGGSSLPDQALFRITIPTVVGYTYRFSYAALATIYSMPYFAVKVNGQQIDNNDIVPQENQWITFSHDIVSTSENTLVELVDLNTEWNGNDFLIDNLSLICLITAATATDTIAITNAHGLVRDTLNVTINEGESYRGHTLAGVYQDTIIGVDADSIIRSRVSMNVNRPLDSCMVQLGGIYYENLDESVQIEVLPSSSLTFRFSSSHTGNLLINGDFEQGNTGFYTEYTYSDCGGMGCGYRTYSISTSAGVDGSKCTGWDGAVEQDIVLWQQTVATEPGCRYRFSYMEGGSNDQAPYFAFLVNGNQVGDIDYASNRQGEWITFEHEFIATSYSTVLQLFDRNLEGGGNDFYLDNFSLVCISLADSMATDSITITNTHGMLFDTVDVTINEGESYRGHMLAGVYQDTVIGSETDSIIHSRVSMTVNRPMDNCNVPLGGNMGGTYFNSEEFYAAGNAEIQVLPANSKTLLYSPETLDVNLLTFGDEDYSNYNQYCGDFCNNTFQWGGRGYNGSEALYMGFGCYENLAFFRIALDSKAGEQYKFSFMANSCNMNRQILAVKVNGVQLPQVDSLAYYVEGTESQWGSFEHLITATGDTTVVELVNLQADAGDWFMDNFRLMKVYTTVTDSITITNTHGLVRDTVDVTINEGEIYHVHTLAGVYQDTILGSETDSIVYARVSMNINHSFGAGTATLATDQEGRVWMGLDDAAIGTQPTLTVQVNPARENRYVLTSLADGSNMQPNGDFERWQDNWSTEYSWGDIPFQGSHHVTLCDTCGRTGRGLAVKGSQLLNKYVYNSEWVNLMVGHRYSFSYWAKSRAANPATLAIAINDQQQEWRLDGCDSLGEAIGEWKRFEHVFTPQRTYSTLIRIVDLNTSAEGNEFFLDDISIVDLTEATDAYRDTVIVRNTHELHYTIVDTTLGEGESYNGHTLAGIYNDTLTFADRDSIVHSRISYALNTSGMGSTTLGSNLDITWVDLDYGTLYNGDSVSVWPTEVRRFGRLVQAQLDTNLISNGDFEQGNTGFSSYYMYRPLPYGLDDSTFMIGGYRIAQNEGNNYFHALYNHANNGPAYTTTVNVEPGGWYLLSFRAVSTVCYADQNNMGPLFHVTVNGTDVASKRFLCSYYDDFYLVTNCGDIDQSGIHTQLVHSDDTVMTIALGHENADYWGWYHFAYDDIRLTPLAVIDTITVTNRHQLVYATVDTTINEGESYNSYTLAGVYQDTVYHTDYDSIVRSRVSMVINRNPDSCQVILGTNLQGEWMSVDEANAIMTDAVVVPPMESRRYVLRELNNMLTDGDFEQGGAWFASHTGYTDNTAYNGHYEIIQGRGVDSSYGIVMDGATWSDSPFYNDTVELVEGHIYEFSYDMMPRNGNPPTIRTVLGDSLYTDYLIDNEIWQHFSHQYVATGGETHLSMIDLCTNYWGNDFDLDNLSLADVSLSLSNDTVTVTNRHQLVYDTVSVDLCQGNSYTVDGIDYSTTGTYTLPTQYYTDSTVYPTLVLHVHNNYYPQLTANICQGESYTFGGQTLTGAGLYVDSLQSVFSCDSIVSLALNVYSHTASTQSEDVCDSYPWHGTVYTASTLVTDTLINAHGCDSVCTLDLTVRYSSVGDTVADVCDLFSWYGQDYTASGMPTHTLTNAVGCDSLLTLNLTVRYSTTGSETMVVCDSITWQGALRSASGDYVETLTNAVGCDSTVTLHLTVNPTYQTSDAVFACDNQLPYLYHEQPLATAGDHTVHFLSAENCDSTVTVTLTVGATYQHSDQLTLCQSGMPYAYGSMTFIEDDTTGTYIVPFSTVEGCDSIVSLDLTVHESEATELYVVTVQATHNLVIWEPEAAIDHYNIYRESSTSGVYSLVAEVPFDEGGMWLDEESDARAHSYRYRISSVDSCGTESEQSPIHRTMHLTINQGVGNSWNLVWTEYEGTSYSTYRIYRGTSYDNMQMIGEIPSDNTTFTDNNAPEGYVYYQIVVLLSPGTKDGSDGTIRSNVATNNQTGIEEWRTENGEWRVYAEQGGVVIEAPEGLPLQVYDVTGRRLLDAVSTGRDRFDVPATGVYLVRAGNSKARRVVVEK